jgi:hypothetical protein
MTGFKEPDIDAGAQTFLQGPIGYFRDAFMCELTSKGSPRFRLSRMYYAVPRRELVFEKQFAERMMGQGKSHSECQKNQMPLEAPSVDLQQEGVQSAKQNVSVMLLQTRYSGYLTMPLKDATSPVDYLR